MTWRNIALLATVPLVGFGLFLTFGGGGFSDRERTLLNWTAISGLWALASMGGLIKKLSTGTYEDGMGAHPRSEDQTTYWYLVAFNVFGILLFVGSATVAVIEFI